MSARPAMTSAQDALRLQMERSIDGLAALAHSDIEPGQFFGDVLRRALQPGGASRVVLWRMSLEGGRWEPIAEMPVGECLATEKISERQSLLNDVAADSHPRVNPETSTHSLVLSPLRHSGST